jgi:hypothetical protein
MVVTHFYCDCDKGIFAICSTRFQPALELQLCPLEASVTNRYKNEPLPYIINTDDTTANFFDTCVSVYAVL